MWFRWKPNAFYCFKSDFVDVLFIFFLLLLDFKIKIGFLHYVILTRTLGEAHYMQMFPFDEIWSTLIRGYFAMEIIVIGMWDRFQFYLQQQQQQKTAPLSPHTNGLNQRW